MPWAALEGSSHDFIHSLTAVCVLVLVQIKLLLRSGHDVSERPRRTDSVWWLTARLRRLTAWVRVAAPRISCGPPAGQVT